MNGNPSNICLDCGDKYRKNKAGGVATFSIGECEWCGEKRMVTHSRTYGYPELKTQNSFDG